MDIIYDIQFIYNDIAIDIMALKELLDCNNLDKFIQTIYEEIIADTLSGAALFRCKYENVTFFSKLVPYKYTAYSHWKPPTNALYSTDVEIQVLLLLRERLIRTNMTPHIIEIIHAITCPVLDSIKDHALCDKTDEGFIIDESIDPYNVIEELCMMRRFIRSKIMLDKFAIVILEPCECSLAKFIDHHLPFNPDAALVTVQAIVFQVYFTLLAIRTVFPSFAHNDMHLENVQMRYIPYNPSEPQTYIQYVWRDRVWNIPFYGYMVKIIDFGNCIIPDENIINDNFNSSTRSQLPIVEDYIKFIITLFAYLVVRGYNIEFLNLLNPSNFTKYVSDDYIAKHQISIEEFFNTIPAFDIFMTVVDKSVILHRYEIPWESKSISGSNLDVEHKSVHFPSDITVRAYNDDDGHIVKQYTRIMK